MTVLSYIITAVAAYLLGSIPTGFLVAKAKGIDIRSVGSGNIGATNAFRVLGKPAGTFVLLVDLIKGFGACFIGALVYYFYVNHSVGLHSTSDATTFPSENSVEHLAVVGGICAVLGHNFTCWLKFKGGKGIATTAGVYLALSPVAFCVVLVTWVVLAFVTRYVSIASIGSAIALPIAVWCRPHSVLLLIVTIALSALAILKHKKNIQRLMNGTENRIGKKAQNPEMTK